MVNLLDKLLSKLIILGAFLGWVVVVRGEGNRK